MAVGIVLFSVVVGVNLPLEDFGPQACLRYELEGNSSQRIAFKCVEGPRFYHEAGGDNVARCC